MLVAVWRWSGTLHAGSDRDMRIFVALSLTDGGALQLGIYAIRHALPVKVFLRAIGVKSKYQPRLSLISPPPPAPS